MSRDRFSSADTAFLALDLDGDGVLCFEEMTDNLRAERDIWDVNHDGYIDLEEWREYMKAFTQRQRRFAGVTENPGTRPPVTENSGIRPPSIPPAKVPLEKPPVGVTIPRNKPKNDASHVTTPTSFLPPWIQVCDTDGDGQVSLYEWKEKGGSVREFMELDLDHDGFVTVNELKRLGYIEPGRGDLTIVLPDPGTLRTFRGEINQFQQFEVTGRLGDSVWGTDIYTDDSVLAVAAVHMGLLQVGQKGVVKVTIMEGQAEYTGSTRHGVTTNSFGRWNRSYRISAGRGYKGGPPAQ